MGGISAAAMGAVGVVTALLGSGRQRSARSGSAQSGAAQSGAAQGGAPLPAAGAEQAAGPTPFAPPQSPAADYPTPTALAIIPRAEWGAVEPQVFGGGQGERGPYDAVANPNGWMVYDQPPEAVIEMVIIHHSALPLSDGPVEIQRLHMEEKGFADVGYQFLINERGELFEGRALNVRGAHTYNFNSGTVGVCLIGNFEEIQPSAAQLAMLDLLLADLLARFPRIDRLAGHKDCNAVTLCPGQNLHTLLPEIARTHNLRYAIG